MSEKMKKESGVQVMHFWTTGEDMTNTARDFWVSNNITGAVNLCLEGLGMNEEQAIQLLTGKMKLIGSTREGDGTLGGVDDNEVSFHGCSLTIEERICRLEQKFIDDSNCRLDAKRRLNYFDKCMDSYGANYRSKVPTDKADGQTMEDDLEKVELMNGSIEKTMKQIELVYRLAKKPMSDLPLDKIVGWNPAYTNADSNYYADELGGFMNVEAYDEHMADKKDDDDFDYDLAKENAKVVVEKMVAKGNKLQKSEAMQTMEGLMSADAKVRDNFLDSYLENSKQSGYKPMSVDEAIAGKHSAFWLLPDGTLFGGTWYAFIHRDIIYDLQESGYFKDKPEITDPANGAAFDNDERMVEYAGWVKYTPSHGWMECYRNNGGYMKPNPLQVEAIIKISRAWKDTKVRYGTWGCSYEKFATLLLDDSDIEDIIYNREG